MSIVNLATEFNGYQVKALYNFAGETEDDLAFKKGDIINVIEEIDESWSLGELQDDNGAMRKGMFPSNYAQKITNMPKAINPSSQADKKLAKSNSTTISDSPQESSEQHFDEQQQIFNKMKAIIPTMGMQDIAMAISSVKLSKSRKESVAKKETDGGPHVGPCSTCGCEEFSQNAFKKGHCNLCFHQH